MLPLSTTSTEAASRFDEALFQYVGMRGDPATELSAAAARDPDFLLAHATLGMLFVLSTGATTSNPTVGACLARVRELLRADACSPRYTPRERAYAHAFLCWAAGRYRAAAAILDGAIADTPTDLLMIRTAHDVHFFNGDSLNLRSSVARAFQAWEPTMPGYGNVCGMLAFGLEECNQYDAAEAMGMRAVNMDPSDAWAVHAVAHVYEMTSRCDEAKRFLTETRDHWEVRQEAGPTGPRVGATLLEHHLLWHWCLFDIAVGDARHAISRYDNSMAFREPQTLTTAAAGDSSPESAVPHAPVLALLDDASLLWRLELNRLPASRSHEAAGAKATGAAQGQFEAGTYQAWGTVDPSAAVSGNYLSFLSALRPADAASAGPSVVLDKHGNRFQPLWLPEGVSAASRWTETARHLRLYSGQHIAAFNDVHVAMALVAAGDEKGLAAHLAGMAAYAGKLSDAGSLLQHGYGDSDILHHLSSGASGGSTVSVPPPLWAAQFPGLHLLALSHSHAASTTPSPLTSPAAGAAEALVEDNRMATAVMGLDLAHGMVAFWRALAAFKQAHATAVPAGSRSEPATSEPPSPSDGDSQGVVRHSTSGWAGHLRSLFGSAAPEPAAEEFEGNHGRRGGAATAFTADATSGSSAAASAPASIPAAALLASSRAHAAEALRLLTQSRPHWSLLGGSLAQRDVFEQTAVHAAMMAGNDAVAMALASERCTVRFADPNAWYLLGSVLEAAGKPDRAADARNRAFALGMGSRGSG